MKYAGRVYDGPWEGRNLENDSPWYEINWMPQMALPSWRDHAWDDPIPMTAVYYRMAYRWSRPLRAWVFDWNSAPRR